MTGDEERTAQRQLRDVVSAVLAVDKEVMTDESMWKRDLLLDKNLSRKLFAMDGIVRIRKNYNNLTGKRNTLNHAGFGDKVQGSDEIVKDLKGFTAKYFDAVVEELPKLLINLSIILMQRGRRISARKRKLTGDVKIWHFLKCVLIWRKSSWRRSLPDTST